MEPARGEKKLDLFFTTNPSLVKNSTFVSDISDHDMVVTDCELRPIEFTTDQNHEKSCNSLKLTGTKLSVQLKTSDPLSKKLYLKIQ